MIVFCHLSTCQAHDFNHPTSPDFQYPGSSFWWNWACIFECQDQRAKDRVLWETVGCSLTVGKFVLIPKSCLISSIHFPWGCSERSWGNLVKHKVYYAESYDLGDSVLECMYRRGHGALLANFTFAAQVQSGYRMICRKSASDEFSRLRRLLEGPERRFQERLFQDTFSFSIGCNHWKDSANWFWTPDVEGAFCTDSKCLWGSWTLCEKTVHISLRVPKSSSVLPSYNSFT